MAFEDDQDVRYDGVIVTSANALRAIDAHPMKLRVLDLPVFAVGGHTAQAARNAGFHNVSSAEGDARALRELVVKSVSAKKLKPGGTLCYFAGADLASDIAAELGAHGFNVLICTVYSMNPVQDFPDDVREAFPADGIEAVLHYSRRSARAFLAASRASGVEISALSLPQCCISEAVASILRDAGARHVTVAHTPDEGALFDALEIAMKSATKSAMKPLSR